MGECVVGDEAALRAAVWQDPEADLPRLVYADYLEDHATDPCPACGGEWVDRIECRACGGSGSVPDGRGDLAAFIRCQVRLSQLESERADLLDSEIDWSARTGLSAAWRPNCGACGCADREESMSDPGCPPHDPRSPHGRAEELAAKIGGERVRELALFAARGAAWFGPAACLTPPGERERGRFDVVARGFVSAAHLPLAAFTSGVARALAAAGPLEGGVWLSDREPYHNGAGFALYNMGRPRPRDIRETANVPTKLFRLMVAPGQLNQRWVAFPTAAEAASALSRAAAAWAVGRGT